MTDASEGIDSGLRIGAAAAALGVSVDTLRRWERAGRVRFERRGNQRYIEAAELARLLRERAGPQRSSARNRLDGIVLSVTKDKVMAQKSTEHLQPVDQEFIRTLCSRTLGVQLKSSRTLH